MPRKVTRRDGVVETMVEPADQLEFRTLAQPRTFSIIVANYNYARFLQDSVGSALAQDHPDFEVIVVDDASTDNSRDVLAAFGDRITLIAKPQNRGHADSFNVGLAAARGEIILFLDSDDYLYPTALSAIAAARRPGAAMYQWRMDLVDGDKRRLDAYPPPETALDQGDVRPLLTATGRFSTTVTSGMAFSREALERAMPIDIGKFPRSGDGYLTSAAPFYGDVVEVPGIHSAYRQHGGNHSQFAQDISNRARWRLEHDAFRLDSIRRHAAAVGLTVPAEPQLRDLYHVQERIASLLIDPARHPYPGDGHRSLAWRGLLDTLGAPFAPRYKLLQLAWWLVVMVLPKGAAGQVISWKLSAASRPDWMRRAAKTLRGQPRAGTA